MPRGGAWGGGRRPASAPSPSGAASRASSARAARSACPSWGDRHGRPSTTTSPAVGRVCAEASRARTTARSSSTPAAARSAGPAARAAAGALSSALIPVLAGLHAAEEEERAWRVVATVVNLMLLALLALSVVVALAAPVLIPLVPPRFAPPGTEAD